MVHFPSASAQSASHAGATSSDTAMPPEAVAIRNAIASRNANAVCDALQRTTLTATTWQALMATALACKSSDGILNALLYHEACQPQAALALAVQHDHVEVARQALMQGAEPEPAAALAATEAMRTLLNYMHRRNMLYPSETPGEDETSLDLALRSVPAPGADEAAIRQLQDKIRGKSVHAAWRDAVKNDQRDVQRGLLLFYFNRNQGIRLLQEDPVKDEGVARVMKEIPYLSPKRGVPLNLNFAARFRGSNEPIVCRHLVEHRQSVQEKDAHLKFDETHFASAESIASHVSSSTHQKHIDLTSHAAEAHLFHNHEFGKTLVHLFADMQDKHEANRLLLLNSPGHALSVALKIKEKDGKTQYVAELFDPNMTTSHVRMNVDDMRTLELLALKNFIPSKDYDAYFRQSDETSIMFVRPAPGKEPDGAQGPKGAAPGRTLTTSIDDKNVSATAFHYMLAFGFAGDLRRSKSTLAQLPIDELVSILSAQRAEGSPGMLIAAENGHADAVDAFGDLLKLVPPEARAGLLAASHPDGSTGFRAALRHGDPDLIDAYARAIEKANLPMDVCVDLLSATLANGAGLALAFKNRRPDTIEAFGRALERLKIPPEKCIELLAARDANKVPGLFTALGDGHPDVITAVGNVLDRLGIPPDMCVDLLAARNAAGHPGLLMACNLGHVDTIKAFGSVLEKLHIPPEQCVELLSAQMPGGSSGLAVAVANGNAAVVRAFGELMMRVPTDMRARLMDTKMPDGASCLAMALECGNSDVVKAVGELLDLVPARDRAALLGTRSANGKSGLAGALQVANLAAVDQYIDIVKKAAPELSPDERAALLKDIRKSHAAHQKGLWWANYPYYEALKKDDAAFYSRFKEMKNCLK